MLKNSEKSVEANFHQTDPFSKKCEHMPRLNIIHDTKLYDSGKFEIGSYETYKFVGIFRKCLANLK